MSRLYLILFLLAWNRLLPIKFGRIDFGLYFVGNFISEIYLTHDLVLDAGGY